MITAHIDFPASPNVPDPTENIIRIPSEPDMSTEMDIKKPILYVPLKEKWLLTIPEAAAYFGVGQNRIADLALRDGCRFVVFVGSKKLIKRKKFEEFLDEQYAI